MNADQAIERELKLRINRLSTPGLNNYQIQCHETAIARLVVQRICTHDMQHCASLSTGKRVMVCKRCKLKFLG